MISLLGVCRAYQFWRP